MALSYTYTLTAGQIENIGHVQQNFADAKSWADANEDAYRTIHEVTSRFGADLVAVTYLFTSIGVLANAAPSGTSNTVPCSKYIDNDDFTVNGSTTKLRVRATVTSNATAPGINFSFGLAPLVISGIADEISYTAGAAVAGSSVAINTPAASTATVGTGSDFNVPSDGLYGLWVATSATQANGNACGLHVELQQHWV